MLKKLAILSFSSAAEVAERYVIITTSGPPLRMALLSAFAWKTIGRDEALVLFWSTETRYGNNM